MVGGSGMNYLVGPEERVARQLTEYLEILKSQKKIAVFTHISNETYTKSWTTKSRNKAMGVRPGTPDYIIVYPHTILFLEIKREKGGVMSQSQNEWQKALIDAGVPAIRANGIDEAISAVNYYIKEKKV
jgi:hypothetical protein